MSEFGISLDCLRNFTPFIYTIVLSIYFMLCFCYGFSVLVNMIVRLAFLQKFLHIAMPNMVAQMWKERDAIALDEYFERFCRKEILYFMAR